MKSTMIVTAAFVRRQNSRMYQALPGLCSSSNHVVSASNFVNKSSVVDSKVLSSLLVSSPSLYSTRAMSCYTSLRDSSLTNSFNTASANDGRYTYRSSLLQSKYFIQQPVSTPSIAISNYQQQQIRTMGTKKNKESKNQKNKAKQKSMIKKQKLQKEQQKLIRQQQKQPQQDVIGDEHSAITASTTTSPTITKGGAAEQHKEWVEFQKSIEVDGFETGQTLSTIDAKKGRSGGKAATKKRLTKRDEMAEKIKERQRLAGGGGGEFPPMRYSDEETERLLQQAYAAIPKRMGKRGTLQLKRQKRRWHLVREIHRKYKAHIVKFHFRRMKRRSTKIKQIIEFISNVAPNTVHQDREYQDAVRQRYLSMIESAAAMRAAKAAASANPSTLEHTAATIASQI
jgi:hypothetical protein